MTALSDEEDFLVLNFDPQEPFIILIIFVIEMQLENS
jgi:hypothetical protein